jgi:hypothetical protein
VLTSVIIGTIVTVAALGLAINEQACRRLPWRGLNSQQTDH